MCEELIVAQCSPTMAGLKTGNLFTCPAGDKKELTESIRNLNARLVPRGVRLLVLRQGNNRALLYMYRPEKLKKDLSDAAALRILSRKGYPAENPERCVAELGRRIKSEEDFPHEVGLFLGYPPEDVDGFIENGAQSAKLVGTWKVYGDEESARRKFAQYKKCTEVYCERFRKNNSFVRLVVAV